MTPDVDAALALWGLKGAQARLVAARENAVYEIRHNTARYALRLHRKGYRSDPELQCELLWMAALSGGGLSVPAPVSSASGQMLHEVNGIQVDVLGWLSGETMDHTLQSALVGERAALYRNLGREMARMHNVSDAWTPPAGFSRCHWDIDGLIGDTPLWNRFWENPGLSSADKTLFSAFRVMAQDHLAPLIGTADYGLIHADLVPGNVMVDGATLHLIDFDDGGYGYRLFDVATALLKQRNAPDFDTLKDALLSGYGDIRGLDTDALDLFMVLRATTYVGWNITRADEDKSGSRNKRFVEVARNLISGFMQAG